MTTYQRDRGRSVHPLDENFAEEEAVGFGSDALWPEDWQLGRKQQ